MYLQNIDRCKIPSDCVNVDLKQNQGLITRIHFQYRFIYGNTIVYPRKPKVENISNQSFSIRFLFSSR